jgi:hypothetical protein
MSFSDTQTLDDQSGDDLTFVLISRDGTGTTRLDNATTLALPGKLVIKHSTSGKGSSAIDRHLVQVTKTVDATPAPVDLVINFTLAVPRVSAVTPQIIWDAVSPLLDFLLVPGTYNGPLSATTTIDALLRGEA